MKGGVSFEEFVSRIQRGREEGPSESHYRRFGRPLFPPNFNAKVVAIAQKRMERVDQMTPEFRALVNEFGQALVEQFVMNGVKKPHRIRHLIAFARGHYEDGRSAFVNNLRSGPKK